MLHLSKIAKQLRKNMTHEEAKLWLQLKHFNKRGFHFRRQSPVDGYILDFVEFGHKLIIEVDGSQHNETLAEKRDAARDVHFKASGFEVVRFWNFEINQNMDGVIDKIQSLLLKPPPALRASSPVKGEDRSG